ncbi:MAG: hypothetical protein KC964_18825, partial [Candidatus Omnitrophica bacterium]|nr:hypothetical protein [Candidatus Omnitrophota bacterium]
EIEVFGPHEPAKNLALNQPANQSSISQWSTGKDSVQSIDWRKRVVEILVHSRGLVADLKESGLDADRDLIAIEEMQAKLDAEPPREVGEKDYFAARWLQRSLTLRNPLLDFDSILFVKRVPGSYSHMSDQYYGWWSRPGGGLYILRDFQSDSRAVECISESFTEPGSFLRPTLSYDATKVLFAWCKHYPDLADEKDKLNKDHVPEDAFYQLFEMDLDGSGVRQLTHGKYDNFDGRYLPDGKIVFLSTRRGQALQCGFESAQKTLETANLPDSYVRCGGGPERPVAVYTLHTMDPDGGNLCAISPFENFEWTPSVANDGTLLYSRWDYVDRYNMPFMGLWRTNPDGSNARIVYGNFTRAPHCTFEPRSIPGSDKIIFTASGHHAQTMGSLVLLDPAVGTEGDDPITRLTPEVPFPEIEGWPDSFYANPWPLSERYHLVSWARERVVREGQLRAPNGMGLYLFDAEGNMELLHRDPEIGSECPIPIRPRETPPILANGSGPNSDMKGRFLISDVYSGLPNVEEGEIQNLRVVAVPAKTQPTMDSPKLGITKDDPGKCVLGTVPVEKDGSAYFEVPAGVIVFFQVLDRQGMAIQTMRTTTHVQPGQTLSCIGCHEPRLKAPPVKQALASLRVPSKIEPGPEGSWPLRFDRLIQPVLDQHCVSCHNQEGEDPKAASFNLASASAYDSLVNFGTPSLNDHVKNRYLEGRSIAGEGAARTSALLSMVMDPEGHEGVFLDDESLERFIVWIDTYAQRAGHFSPEQENELVAMRQKWHDLLKE